MAALGDTLLVDGVDFASGVLLLHNVAIMDGAIVASGSIDSALRAVLGYNAALAVGHDYLLSASVDEIDEFHSVSFRMGGTTIFSTNNGEIGTFHAVIKATVAATSCQVIFSTGAVGKVGSVSFQPIVDG